MTEVWGNTLVQCLRHGGFDLIGWYLIMPAGGDSCEDHMSVTAREATAGWDKYPTPSAVSFGENTLVEGDATRGPPNVLAAWKVRCIQAYIAAHLHSTIRVADLVRVFQLSPNRFGQAFKNSFDCTPYQYVMSRRIARAQRRLLTSEDTLSEIATECGFSNKSHLSNLFRRTTGQPPGKWRRRRSP
jgi:AraC-like DNA-binding protein